MPISCYNTTSVIEISMAVIMTFTIAGVFWRIIRKNKGIGIRLIQFTCVVLIIPTIVILAIENIIKGETVATIIGGLIGYVLSGVNDSASKKNGDAGDAKSTAQSEA